MKESQRSVSRSRCKWLIQSPCTACAQQAIECEAQGLRLLEDGEISAARPTVVGCGQWRGSPDALANPITYTRDLTVGGRSFAVLHSNREKHAINQKIQEVQSESEQLSNKLTKLIN